MTYPNPAVGAVVVDRGGIIGEGYHHRAGQPHAEVLALRQAGAKARGQSLYVTLEPCNHTGRTPPCTEAILAAGVAEVHVAVLDPNPEVAGHGVDRLRQAGVQVVVGEAGAEAFSLNRPYFCWALCRRPLVVLKSAMSFDGKVATAEGQSKYLTHTRALAYAHEQRRRSDAILVGVETALQDDPALTYRGRRRGLDPARIVLDSHGRMRAKARMLHTRSTAPTLIFTATEAPAAWEREMAAAGAEVVRLPLYAARLPLDAVLRELGRRRLQRLLVEGGPTVHAALVRQGLADEWIGLMAPLLLGADGLSAVGELNVATLVEGPRLIIRRVSSLGDDALIEADFAASEAVRVPPRLIEAESSYDAQKTSHAQGEGTGNVYRHYRTSGHHWGRASGG